MIQYHILKDGVIIHTSDTAFTNKDMLLHVLINQFHTPIDIVVGYIKNPDAYTVIPVSEYIKPKRTRKTQKKDTTTI